jgi:PQQ-like domain
MVRWGADFSGVFTIVVDRSRKEKAVKLLTATLAGLCLLPGIVVSGGAQDPASLTGAISTDAVIGPVNWPQFRFNDKHTGLNNSEKILTRKTVRRLQLAWQDQLGKIVDYSSPAVVDGVVYIGTVDGRLWAYPDTGCGSSFCTQPLWSSVGLGQIVDSPAVSNGIVYVGSQTSDDSNDGRLNAFSASGCGQPVCAPLWQGLAGTESILRPSPRAWCTWARTTAASTRSRRAAAAPPSARQCGGG